MNKKSQQVIFMVVGLLLMISIIFAIINMEGFFFDKIILVILIALFGVFFLLKRNTKDVVIEDEFSKKILNKAAARSFYMSMYMFLLIMYLMDRFADPESAIGVGIAGMGILFLLNYLYVKISGKIT